MKRGAKLGRAKGRTGWLTTVIAVAALLARTRDCLLLEARSRTPCYSFFDLAPENRVRPERNDWPRWPSHLTGYALWWAWLVKQVRKYCMFAHWTRLLARS